MTCIINIILFSLVEFFCLKGNRNQTTIAYISVSSTLALFTVVLIYHIFTEFISKQKFWSGLIANNRRIENDQPEESELVQPLVTHSEIAGPTRELLPLSAPTEASEYEDQDNRHTMHISLTNNPSKLN